MIGPGAVELVEHYFRGETAPLRRPCLRPVGSVREDLPEVVIERVGFGEEAIAGLQDRLSMLVSHGVVAAAGAVQLQQFALGDALRVLVETRELPVADEPVRGDGAGLVADAELFGHHVVFKAGVEHRPTGITLPARSAPQLPVEARGVVPSEPDDEQATGLGSSWTELNVDASAGHLRGHGDRTVVAGAGDDPSLGSVVLRIEHPRLDTQLGEQSGEALRISHAPGADEHRLPRIMGCAHGLGCGGIALLDSYEQTVGGILADARAVGGDDPGLDVEVLGEALGRFDSSAAHPGEGPIAASDGLHEHLVEDLGLSGHLQPLFALDGGVETVRPTLTIRNPATGIVDQLHPSIGDEVVHVAFDQRMRVQRDMRRRQQVDVLLRIQVIDPERRFDTGEACLGERDTAPVALDLIVLVIGQVRDDLRQGCLFRLRVGLAGEPPAPPVEDIPITNRREDFVAFVIEQVARRKAAEDAFFARLDDADLDIDADPDERADSEDG